MRCSTMGALLLFGAATLTTASDDVERGFRMVSTVLYQADPVLQRRLGSVHPLASYMKALEGQCDAFFKKRHAPRALDVVVAIRPLRRAKVWFVSPTQEPKDEVQLAKLQARLEVVPVPDVFEGPVLFAMIGSIAGADRANRPGELAPIPLPQAWQDALEGHDKKKAVDTDRLLDLVWPETESR